MSETNNLSWSEPTQDQTEAMKRIVEILGDGEALDDRKLFLLREETLGATPALSEEGLNQLRELIASEAPLARLEEQIRAAVSHHGWHLLRGIPAHSRVLLIGLALSLGRPIAAANGGFTAGIFPHPPNAQYAIAQTRLSWQPQTASTLFREVPEYVVFACEQRGPEAGGSLSILHVSEILDALDTDAIAWLHESVFPFPVQDPILGGQGPKLSLSSQTNQFRTDGVRLAPILSERSDSDFPAIRYRAEAIQAAIGMDGVTPPTRPARDALSRLNAVVGDRECKHLHDPEPGDVLFLDNRAVLIGRTAISPQVSYVFWRLKVTVNPAILATEQRLATHPI